MPWTLSRALGAAAVLLAMATTTTTTHAGDVSNLNLGSCLTQDWVASMETALKVNASERDALGRLVNPFLHAAKRTPVFRISDPRTASAGAYDPACIPKGGVVYGAGVVMESGSMSKVKTQGEIDGAFVVELSGWPTHSLSSVVFSILLSEVVGYPVAHYHATNTLYSAQRMSSAPNGLCTPVHINLEVWTAGKEAVLRQYSNESYAAGPIGYAGSAGLYTTTKFINDSAKAANPSFPAYWMSYKLQDDVINALPVSYVTNNTKYYPPKEDVCKDDVMGCLNSCSKTAACTAREQGGKTCLLVVMMVDVYDPGFFQAVLANLGVPAYFCFIGYDGVEAFAAESVKAGKPIVFYHFEPNLFFTDHAGKVDRIFLPRSIPERAITSTGLFGENGYGKETNNPVDVDFPSLRLAKYAATVLQTSPPAASLAGRFTIEDLDINKLLQLYSSALTTPNEKDPTFAAACSWVKTNFQTWSGWLDRLPLCTFEAHIQYTVTGCDGGADSARTISFAWKVPHPDDPALPYECDGGMQRAPEPLRTSRSCEWITTNVERWRSWISKKPECDASFYKYNVTDCDSGAKRTVQYWWLLARDDDLTQSGECVGGAKLPASVRIDCDFMPSSSPTFMAVAVVAGALIALQLAGVVFVFLFRNKPIIKRSQYEFLLLMLAGGILVCAAAIVYAGRPSNAVCAGRPLLISMGFTTVFGSLFVKSLRVYRVFMRTALKRVTVTMWMMIKVFAVFFFVDVLILAVWFIVDFPSPTVEYKPAPGFQGDVDRITCKSSSFMFTALLIFWKAMLLFLGLYISFLVRNVSADFQESIWIFASSVIVLVSCMFILPLAYLVEMPAAAFYVFLAVTLILSAAAVTGMMLVPKFFRLNEESKSSKYSTTASGATKAPMRSGKESTEDMTRTGTGIRVAPSKIVDDDGDDDGTTQAGS
ncbi:hypothetical protein P43SY_006919 [Pythium insidiosum]|uniref:G-protein coupled receptors family 3 profile domain-containing protein n=1 Tax=Pythium insidiosum TaxID=114742 RepID=A0AAD5LPT4_PYTIN|nr:hypothetical protein P43SY_006919 [Pythium insidiosum]